MPGRVGGAEDHAAQPGHGEEHAAVARLGNNQGMVAREKFPPHDEVDALARCHHVGGGGVVEPPNGIHPHAGGVHDATGGHLEPPAGLAILDHNPGHAAARLDQSAHPTVVDHDPAGGHRRAGQRHRQAGVVELAVPVGHAADEVLLLDAWDGRERSRAAAEPCRPQGGTAGEQAVGLEADGIDPPLPEPASPAIGGQHEGQRAGEVRRVVEQKPPLAERFPDESHVALSEIADAAVNEFRGPARGALRKVFGLNKRN